MLVSMPESFHIACNTIVQYRMNVRKTKYNQEWNPFPYFITLPSSQFSDIKSCLRSLHSLWSSSYHSQYLVLTTFFFGIARVSSHRFVPSCSASGSQITFLDCEDIECIVKALQYIPIHSTYSCIPITHATIRETNRYFLVGFFHSFPFPELRQLPPWFQLPEANKDTWQVTL